MPLFSCSATLHAKEKDQRPIVFLSHVGQNQALPHPHQKGKAMKLLHSYARFSDPKQSEGDSHRRQAKITADFLEKHPEYKLANTLLDAGKSGFRGDKQKALTQFLKLIEEGKIRAGDTLLVESIDRLSRKGIRATQEVVNQILNAGIDIAIASPIEKIYHANDKNDFAGTIELAAFAYAAFVYSKQLSDRIKRWFEGAREQAEKGHLINSGPTPAWINRTFAKEGKKKTYSFELIPERAEAVKFIFAKTIEGIGQKRLCKMLNDKFPPMGTEKKGKKRIWNETYIRQILIDRRVLGDFQPHISDEQGKRQPTGEPIKDYYPAVIKDEQIWRQAQASSANRRVERGPTKEFTNLFTGIVSHALDKCSCHIYTYQQIRADGRKVIFRRLKSEHAQANVKGASTETVDLIQFEQAVLRNLREIDLSVFTTSKSKAAELAAVNEHLKERIEHLAKLQNKADESGQDLDALTPNIIKAKQAISDLRNKVDALKLTQSNSATEGLESIKYLKDLDNTPENRQKLREAIKRVVNRITILPVKLGTKRSDTVGCLIEIELSNGKRRSILLCEGKSLTYTDDSPDSPSLWESTTKAIEKRKVHVKNYLLSVH